MRQPSVVSGEHIVKVIAQFCQNVAQEPLCFFSEADLQSQLYSDLRQALPELFPTSVTKSGDGSGPTTYRTSLIHREYGAGGARRLDLVIFSPEQVKKISDRNLCEVTDDGVVYIKPDYAIELGTEKSPNAAVHVMNDLSKLHDRVSTRGFLIHFFRNTCDVPIDTMSYKNRVERIINPYRMAVEAGAGVAQSNVTILAFLLTLGRRDLARVSRCEMYSPRDFVFDTKRVKGATNWHRISLQRVAEAVTEVCCTQSAMCRTTSENTH